jgi:hypothetical protein
MLPRIGPNIVALLNAVMNWTVGLYILFLFFTISIVSISLFIAFGNDSKNFLHLHDGLRHLLRLSFAEEFNNIQDIGTRPIITVYSISYLLVLLVMLNIFLAIVSERYLKALEESQKMWEQLVTSSMEQDRRSRRNSGWNNHHKSKNVKIRKHVGVGCFQKSWRVVWNVLLCRTYARNKKFVQTFKGNLWTSAMQNVLIQTRVLGKERAHVPKCAIHKRPSKRYRLLGHALHFDASTVKRESTSSSQKSSQITATQSEKTLRNHNSMMDLNEKKIRKMDETLSELSTMLRQVHVQRKKKL